MSLVNVKRWIFRPQESSLSFSFLKDKDIRPWHSAHLDPPSVPHGHQPGVPASVFYLSQAPGESEKASGRLAETMRKCARLTGPTVSGLLKPQGPSISSQVPLPSMPALAQPLGSSSHPRAPPWGPGAGVCSAGKPSSGHPAGTPCRMGTPHSC